MPLPGKEKFVRFYYLLAFINTLLFLQTATCFVCLVVVKITLFNTVQSVPFCVRGAVDQFVIAAICMDTRRQTNFDDKFLGFDTIISRCA